MRRRDLLRFMGLSGLAAIWPGYVCFAKEQDVIFLRPGDAAYAPHAQLFNKRLSLRPAIIAVCSSETGVQQALALAESKAMSVSIRSGGHSFEGYSSNNGGLVIDLTMMNTHTLHTDGRLVAQPAVRLMQLYENLLPAGRLLPTGSCGMVGLAGITMGGGYGLFSRQYGLTCDWLKRLRMVKADGKVIEIDSNSDLMWACRGGGNGHFGIITELEYDTVAAPQTLTRYLYKAYKLTPDRAVELARHWFESMPELPQSAFSAFVLNGHTLTILITDTSSQPVTMKTFDKSLSAIMDKRYKPKSDPLQNAVSRYYGRLTPLNFKNASGGFYQNFQDIEAVAKRIFRMVLESKHLLFQVNTLGGAIDNPQAEPASCYPHRKFPFLAEVQSYWDTKEQETSAIQGVAQVQTLLAENGVRHHYCNYPDANFEQWPKYYYGEKNYQRLQQLKQKYDPENRFRYPQSIRPPGNIKKV